jgi:MFS family permease
MTPRSAWLAVTAMFVLNGGLFGVWASRVPAVVEIHGLSHADLGILLLFIAGGAVLSFPFAGRAVDRFGAASVTRAVALVYPLSLITVALMPGFATLAAALFVFGMLYGAMDVAMNGWGAEVERHFARQMMSSFHAMYSLGAGIGALSGYLAVRMDASLTLHFAVMAVLLTGVCLFLARLPWDSPRTTVEDAPVFAFPTGILAVVGFVALCASLGEGAMADWSAVYLRDVAFATEGQAALGYAVFSVAMVAMRLLGDRLATRFGPTGAARIGGVLALIGTLTVVAIPSVTGVLTGFAFMGLGYAVIMPLAFSRAANDPNVPQGQAIASVATLGYGGMLLGPPIIGFLSGLVTLRLSFLLLAALAALIVVFAKAMQRP